MVGDGLVVKEKASPDPGAMLLDRTRLPTGEPGKPARVGEGTRIGGNAVVCGGITVGAYAVVSAGEAEEVQWDLEGRVEDDVPDRCVDGRAAVSGGRGEGVGVAGMER